MTRASFEYNPSTNEDAAPCKRRKSNAKSETNSQSLLTSSSSSSNPSLRSRQRFNGPVSIPYDDVEKIARTKDPSRNAPNQCNARDMQNLRSDRESLYGGRGLFDSLGKSNLLSARQNQKRDEYHQLHSREERTKILSNEETGQEQLALSISNPNKAESSINSKAATLNTGASTLVKRAFKKREYLAPLTLPPSRIHTFSKQGRLWTENQIKSSLLRLPDNVRMRIYELILGGNTIEFGFQNYLSYKDHPTYTVRPVFRYVGEVYNALHVPLQRPLPNHIKASRGMSLLSGVCRQLYRETSHLPYKLNVLAFRSYNVMFNLLVMEKRLTRCQREAITQLFVMHELPGRNILELLPNLKRVMLMGNRDSHHLTWPQQSQQCRGQGWYRVVGSDKGLELAEEVLRISY